MKSNIDHTFPPLVSESQAEKSKQVRKQKTMSE